MKGDSFVPTNTASACCADPANLGLFEIYGDNGPKPKAVDPATGEEHEMVLGFRRCRVCHVRHFYSYPASEETGVKIQ